MTNEKFLIHSVRVHRKSLVSSLAFHLFVVDLNEVKTILLTRKDALFVNDLLFLVVQCEAVDANLVAIKLRLRIFIDGLAPLLLDRITGLFRLKCG